MDAVIGRHTELYAHKGKDSSNKMGRVLKRRVQPHYPQHPRFAPFNTPSLHTDKPAVDSHHAIVYQACSPQSLGQGHRQCIRGRDQLHDRPSRSSPAEGTQNSQHAVDAPPEGHHLDAAPAQDCQTRRHAQAERENIHE